MRGINVGGHKRIKMVDPNVLSLQGKIKNGIAKTFGFDVTVIVKTRIDLMKILKESPFTKAEDIEANKIYYVVLKNEPEQVVIASINQENYPNELFSITKNCVYLNCINGARKAKLNNNTIEQKLKVEATTRNHRTMLKLIELSK